MRLQMYVIVNAATTEILDLQSTGMSSVSFQGPGWIPRASLLPVEWLAMAIIKEMDLDSVVIRRVEILDVNQSGQVLALLLG